MNSTYVLQKFCQYSLCMLLSLCGYIAYGAQDGQLSPKTTQGHITVSAHTAPEVKIFNLHDVTLQWTDNALSSGLKTTLHPCVYHTTPYGLYRITFTSRNSGDNRFVLQNSSQNMLEYRVNYQQDSSISSDLAMLSGQTSAIFSALSESSVVCDSTKSSTIGIEIDAGAPAAGIYRDVLEVKVDAA